MNTLDNTPKLEKESSIAYMRRVHACVMQLPPDKAKQVAEFALALNYRDGMNRRINRSSLTFSYRTKLNKS